MSEVERTEGKDFIRARVDADMEKGTYGGRVHTRFPPEPNGYLHIGHAKSIVLNFGIAKEYGGLCNLRFDDTNPIKEDIEYIESIQEDVKWLGYNWDDRMYFAADYFDKLYEYAVQLIKKGMAYVDSLSPEEIREYRGTPTEAGKNSPYRDRPIEENIELFESMKNGEFEEGEHVLRAKIDMASSNMNMRDPTIYRIRKIPHHRTGDKWCIYPMYDFAHGLSDSIEGITHSICTLEFENHRPLYDWFLEQLEIKQPPQQIEFNRLNITYTVLSKRKLLELVQGGHVESWDDPRMPTISGMRRRGVTPTAIKNFVHHVGVSKTDSLVDIALLEYYLREHLNRVAPRVMAVLNPLEIEIENYPEGQVEWFESENNPEDLSAGTRQLPFSRNLYIEREDFREDPPKKFFRLAPGREIRLKHAYYITCKQVIKNDEGGIIKLICTYDPESRGGGTPDGRKVKGTSHWVAKEHAFTGTVRQYDRLFMQPDPTNVEAGSDYKESLNPDSLHVLENCKFEPSLKDAKPEQIFQFLRKGYFCVDSKDSGPGNPVFNRAVTLRDAWAKIEKQIKQKNK